MKIIVFFLRVIKLLGKDNSLIFCFLSIQILQAIWRFLDGEFMPIYYQFVIYGFLAILSIIILFLVWKPFQWMMGTFLFLLLLMLLQSLIPNDFGTFFYLSVVSLLGFTVLRMIFSNLSHKRN